MSLIAFTLKQGRKLLLVGVLVLYGSDPAWSSSAFKCIYASRDLQAVRLSARNMPLSAKKIIMDDGGPIFDVVLYLEDGFERGDVGIMSGYFVFRDGKTILLSRNSSINDEYFDLIDIGHKNMQFIQRSFTRMGDETVFMTFKSGVCAPISEAN